MFREISPQGVGFESLPPHLLMNFNISNNFHRAVSIMSPREHSNENLPAPMKRKFGKLEFNVTTLALGGKPQYSGHQTMLTRYK